ncbi:unnamed protein product [Cylicocyclus nassatus]|uniref:Uncharacterized protein n=1 Tax=Cylicocyclus nassatus TaxID=53992 RepID=A0AA36M194_CYLNA|nr:unnamed protein product [Cylicocyclus nassatus]
MWFTLWSCILLALACEVQATTTIESGMRTTPPPPPPAENRTSVKNAADFFPFQLNGDVNLMTDLAPDTEIVSYNKPGFATLYREFSGSFIIPLHPSCVAVYLCFVKREIVEPTATGIKKLELMELCKTSLRFMPMEQMIYEYKEGTLTRSHEYVLSYAYFRVKDTQGDITTYTLEVFDGFEYEDLAEQTRKTVTIQADSSNYVFILSNSQYCHAQALRERAEPMSAEKFKIEPELGSQLAVYYTYDIDNKPKQLEAPYVITNIYKGSTYKIEEGYPDSTLLPGVTKVSYASEEDDCCPDQVEFGDFVPQDGWYDTTPHPIANEYALHQLNTPKCKEAFNVSSPLQAVVLEVDEECLWVQVCFDRKVSSGGSYWCEESGKLSLIFVHDVFIPTDSEQAINFGIDRHLITKLRINFMWKRAGIMLEYGFTSPSYPMFSHSMHLDPYEKVGFDPSQMMIHIIKHQQCRARIVTANGDIYGSPVYQCTVVTSCKCVKYEK